MAMVPVMTEKGLGTNLQESLQLARILGDRLSPENELVQRIRSITTVRPAVVRAVPAAAAQANGSRASVSSQGAARKPVPVSASASPWRAGPAFPVACGMLAATVVDDVISGAVSPCSYRPTVFEAEL